MYFVGRRLRGSVIKIEYHKSGQECLEQKLKEIKKLNWEFQRLRSKNVSQSR